jgi:Ca2+-binding RTX toxin-like protein
MKGFKAFLGALAAAGLLTVGVNAGVAHAVGETCVDQRTGRELTANKVGNDWGTDVFDAEPGDVIATRGGDDIVYVGEFDSDVVICLGDGNDATRFRLVPAQGSLSVMGGPGNDQVAGGNSFDVLNGGAGFDVVNAHGGYDVCKNADFLAGCEALG